MKAASAPNLKITQGRTSTKSSAFAAPCTQDEISRKNKKHLKGA